MKKVYAFIICCSSLMANAQLFTLDSLKKTCLSPATVIENVVSFKDKTYLVGGVISHCGGGLVTIDTAGNCQTIFASAQIFVVSASADYIYFGIDRADQK